MYIGEKKSHQNDTEAKESKEEGEEDSILEHSCQIEH
jgi:hypothetical protein